MPCLWVLLETQKSAQSLQELKLNIVPANQNMGATSQGFRCIKTILKMTTFGEMASCADFISLSMFGQELEPSEGTVSKEYANDLPCSQPEGKVPNYKPMASRTCSKAWLGEGGNTGREQSQHAQRLPRHVGIYKRPDCSSWHWGNGQGWGQWLTALVKRAAQQ